MLIVAAAVIFLTELTSNTATAATLIPVLAALAPGLGVHPYRLVFSRVHRGELAFMMPVATPPNAIVFGSGRLTIPQMCKAGLWLNVIGIVLVTFLAMVGAGVGGNAGLSRRAAFDAGAKHPGGDLRTFRALVLFGRTGPGGLWICASLSTAHDVLWHARQSHAAPARHGTVMDADQYT